MLPVVVVGTCLRAPKMAHMDNNYPSGSMVAALKLVDPPRLSPFALRFNSRLEIWLCRYDGSSVVSRSIELGQPIIFVSMNYR